jgi:hypothetical protein
MFEAYSIGVRISLVNHASAGLLGLSRAFVQTEQDAKRLQKRLDSIQSMAIKGGALLGVGAAGLTVVGKMIKPAAEYAHQLQLMNVTGMKHLEIIKATKAAWDAAKTVPTANAAENLAAIRELRMVFGDTGHAIQYMPVVQRMQGVLSNLLGGNAGDQAYTIAKALEMKGAVKDPGQFSAQADMITKAMIASGGKVSGNDFLSAFKYGRAATTGWNDAFAYTILPTLIQEMKTNGGSGGGSGGPGNALMSMYAAVVGGTIPQKSLKVWEKLGLLDPSKIVWTKTHSAKGVEPGGIMGSAMFQANPFEWTQKVLAPALAKAGYNTPEKQKEALQYLFPNRTSGFVATQMLEQPWKFKRDQGLIAQASGIDAYNQLLKSDPMMAEMALQKQWNNLQAQLAFTIMPKLIKGFTWLTDEMEKMTKWAKNHTTTVKVLMWSFIGLSASMAFGGAVLLLGAAFRGLGLALAFNAIGGSAGVVRLASSLGIFGKAMLFSEVGGAGGILSIGKSLTSVVGALGLLSQAAGVFVAAYAGWKAGGYLYDNYYAGTKAGDRIGAIGAHVMAFLGNREAQASVDRMNGRGPVNHTGDFHGLPPSVGPRGVVHTTINIDGRKVAEAITPHQARAASRPQSGVSGFDPTRYPTPVGVTSN